MTRDVCLDKLNVVDALIGVLLFGLVPLLYARLPAVPAACRPALTSIEPARIQAGSDVDLTIRGNHLRPFMRVSFDAHQASSFLFADTSRAIVSDRGHAAWRVRRHPLRPGPGAGAAAEGPGSGREPAGRDTTRRDWFVYRRAPSRVAAQLKEGMALVGFGQILRLAPPAPSVTRTMVAPGRAGGRAVEERLQRAGRHSRRLHAGVPRQAASTCAALGYSLDARTRCCGRWSATPACCSRSIRSARRSRPRR